MPVFLPTGSAARIANVANLPSIRKAAVLLTSLPEDEAAKIMAKLDSKQVEAVSIEIAKMGNTAGDEQEIIINEFADATPGSHGRQFRRLGSGAERWSKKRWGKTPPIRSITFASKLKRCRSDFCRRSTARIC